MPGCGRAVTSTASRARRLGLVDAGIARVCWRDATDTGSDGQHERNEHDLKLHFDHFFLRSRCRAIPRVRARGVWSSHFGDTSSPDDAEGRLGRFRVGLGLARARSGDGMNVITLDATGRPPRISITRFSQSWERLIGTVPAGLRSPTQCSTTMQTKLFHLIGSRCGTQQTCLPPRRLISLM